MGAELIGGAKPDSEAEAIALADGMLRSVGVAGDIHVGYLGLIRSILGKIGAEHRSSVMRMIDKKERSALAVLLEDIGQSHLGLLELIDLKGQPALDKAAEIVLDMSRWPAGEAAPASAPAGVSILQRVAARRARGGRSPPSCGWRNSRRLWIFWLPTDQLHN